MSASRQRLIIRRSIRNNPQRRNVTFLQLSIWDPFACFMRSLMCVKAFPFIFLKNGTLMWLQGVDVVIYSAMVWFAAIRPRWIKVKVFVVVVVAANVITVFLCIYIYVYVFLCFLFFFCFSFLLLRDIVSVHQTCLEPSDRYIMLAFWSSRRISMRHPMPLGTETPWRVAKGKLQ